MNIWTKGGYLTKKKIFRKKEHMPQKVDILQKKRIFYKNVDILQKSGYFYKLKSEIWSNRKTFEIHLVVASMRLTSETRINFESKSSRLFPQRKFSWTLQNFGNAQLHAGKSFEIAATLAQGKLTVTLCFWWKCREDVSPYSTVKMNSFLTFEL